MKMADQIRPQLSSKWYLKTVTVFVVHFTGFPWISWNAGAESKYLDLERLDLRPSRHSKQSLLCPSGRETDFNCGKFQFEMRNRGLICWGEVAGRYEVSLQFSRERLFPLSPHMHHGERLPLLLLPPGAPW